MKNPVDSVRETFALTRDADLAALLGVIPQAVNAWRKRARIPPARCLQLIMLARERNVALPDEIIRTSAEAA